ncbi:MAG: LuxR C-terminal-related transcriptional regulator [Synechococcaceae cyanobacterium]
MLELERQQARQWLKELAASLEPWRLVIVSGSDLFAGVMVWTYPGVMRRASSLADLRGLLSGEAGTTTAPAVAAPTDGPTSAPTGAPCAPRRPVPQQLLPVGSDAPGCLDPLADLLFFRLCDDLPDGELEQALALLQPIAPERRRVLAVLGDHTDRQRLQSLQERGVDGLCTQGSCGQGRIYTAVDLIASGGTYLDPLFRQRLTQTPREGRVRSVNDLTAQERTLLRDVCRGYNSLEIAKRRGLAHNSVRRYLSQSYQRLGVRDRAQAIGWSVAHGLVSAAELRLIFPVEES